MLNLRKLRKVELTRRVGSLPGEVAAWRTRSQSSPPTLLADVDNERKRIEEFQSRFATAHSSQLAAIEGMVRLMVEGHAAQAVGMDPNGSQEAFTNTALNLVLRTVVAQRFWDYFRDKFELRFSPQFGKHLWVADTVAYDCYTPVIQRAVELGALQDGSFREPPLTYLNAETSPLTWLRSQRPVQQGEVVFSQLQSLPFPVIELPWEQMENLWELMALHHEVGHDLEKDLGLVGPLDESLRMALEGKPQERQRTWNRWRKEVFADLVALQLGGPSFARSLASIVLFPDQMVKKVSSSTRHPTHYLRIRLCTAYLRTMQLDAAADELDSAWTAVYGSSGGQEIDALLSDFPSVIESLMDRPLAELKDRTVRDLIPYEVADEQVIAQLAGFMLNGTPPPANIRARYVISAGHVAVVALLGADLADDVIHVKLNDINANIERFVTRAAPLGVLRAAGDEVMRRADWKNRADAILQQSFEFQGELL